MPSKLTAAARNDIQLQLQAGCSIDDVVDAFRISKPQAYKMRANLKAFGNVAPDAAQFQVQGKPVLVSSDARDGVLDFCLTTVNLRISTRSSSTSKLHGILWFR